MASTRLIATATACSADRSVPLPSDRLAEPRWPASSPSPGSNTTWGFHADIWGSTSWPKFKGLPLLLVLLPGCSQSLKLSRVSVKLELPLAKAGAWACGSTWVVKSCPGAFVGLGPTARLLSARCGRALDACCCAGALSSWDE